MAQNDTQQQLINLQAQQLAAQVANWAAQLDFQKERFRLLELPQFQQGYQLDVDKFAWQKAMDQWDHNYQEALLTGTFNGQPTIQWLTDQAKLTGTYNGQRTLEGLLTDAQIKDMQDKMKLANDQFITATTGYYNGKPTFDREKFQAAQALEGWKFISTLSGPQNAFKQARAIASMPGGMSQLMQAYAGQYMLPAGTAVGSGGAGGANPAGQLADMMQGFGGPAAPGNPQYGYGQQPAQAPAPPQMAAPATPFAPPADWTPPDPNVPPGTTANQNFVPGRGISIDQWNDATKAAAIAWNASHPGQIADGSSIGWRPPTSEDLVTTPNYGYAGGAQPPAAVAALPPGTTGVQGMSYEPPGVQAPVGAYNYSATSNGSVGVYPPGVASPPQTADVSSYTPVAPGEAAAYLSQPYQYGQASQITAPGGNYTLAPNQIDAQNYNNSFQYQKDLLWAGFEDQGYDKGLAQEAYQRTLPTHKSPTVGAYSF